MPRQTIEIDTSIGLDPLAVILDNGGIAITPARIMIGAGMGIGIVAAAGLIGDGAVAHAHDQPQDTTDTPLVVIVEEDSNVESQMLQQGYTKQEINNDLLRHGISLEEGMNLQVPAGSSWSIDPETVAERESRIEGSLTLSIETGGATFWKQLDDMGLGDTVTVEAILKDNGRNLRWTERALDGASIVVNKKYFPDAPESAVPNSTEPETFQLTLQEDSIIEDLRERKVDNSTAVGIEAVSLSGMTEEESREMHLGDSYSVRKSSLPESIIQSESQNTTIPIEDLVEPTVVTLEQPGDSLSEILEELGSDNPTRDAQATLDSMGLSRDDAENHSVGFEYLVPGNIELVQDPIVPVALTEQEQVLPENPRIKIFGDSLTEGMNDLGELVQRGSDSGLVIDSGDAEVGRSLSDVLNSPINIEEILGYDAVVMALGTNPGEDDQAYIDKLSTFFTQIKTEAATRGIDTPELFVVTLYEAAGSNSVHDETRNPLLANLAVEQGINLIDWASFASTHPETYADGSYHPADYNTMSELFVSELSQKLLPPTDVPLSTPEVVPADIPVEIPVEAVAETEASQVAYNLLTERITANGGFLDKQSAQEIWHWLKTATSHPEKSEDFQNPEMFIKTPVPSVDFPYVVHPRTCTTELYAKPAGVFSAMVNVATLEYLLTNPQWAMYRNMVIELGDLTSGDHKTHGHGDKGDFRSRILTSLGSENPDGALLNSLSPNYDQEFTIQFLVLLGNTISPNGEFLYEHIEFEDRYVIDEVNSRLGRRLMKYVDGHSEHVHENAGVEGETEDGVQGTPNTTTGCTFDYVNADPALINAVMERRANYPVNTPVIDIPTQDISDSGTEQALPTQEQLVASALEISADEYINTFNNGEKYSVQLQNGSKAVEVPSEVQQAVDVVWRLEGGVSSETVINALTVSLAESGLDNSAMNPNTGDRCLFQINKINRQFIDQINAQNGWNIDYDNLQNDIVGCARVAFALYKMDLDFQYSKEYVDEYVNRFGLRLQPEMYEQLTNNNPVSLGFRAWLMSAKNHGLY